MSIEKLALSLLLLGAFDTELQGKFENRYSEILIGTGEKDREAILF